MKLLYINKIETNKDWGLETFINRSLKQIGIATICVDYQENAYSLSQKLLEIEEDFDAVLLQRGCGYLIPSQILKAIQRPKFFLFTELVSRNPEQHYLLNSDLFEHIFLRSVPCIRSVISRSWLSENQASLVLSAIEPAFHYPIPNLGKDIDVLFVGTLLPRRKEIVQTLSNHFSVQACTAFNQEMITLFNRAKIVINLHGSEFPDTETRVYEALACRAFLITETLSEENPFQNGVHLVEVKTIQEMIEAIAYYLKEPNERQIIAELGYQEVLQKHTFDHRSILIKNKIDSVLCSTKNLNDPFNYYLLKRCIVKENLLEIKDKTLFKSRLALSYVKRKFFLPLIKK